MVRSSRAADDHADKIRAMRELDELLKKKTNEEDAIQIISKKSGKY